MLLKPWIFYSTLLLCQATLAGHYQGRLIDLQGHPISNAQISASGDSTRTGAAGEWSLNIAAGVQPQHSLQKVKPSTLTNSNGHLAVRHEQATADGRLRREGSTPNGTPRFATREALPTDTIMVHWNHKRLITLPVFTPDSSGITFEIDTAWNTDFGIPWNPKIRYGTLVDPRDWQTYRTVTVGGRTWMAENLAFVVDSSWLYRNDLRNAKFGRLYTWTGAMGLGDSCLTKNCTSTGNRTRGICPKGWLLPTLAAWIDLIATIQSPTGTYLKSTTGWDENGDDSAGFRALPGLNRYFNGSFDGANGGSWWAATDYNQLFAESIYMYGIHAANNGDRKQYALSVRCQLE